MSVTWATLCQGAKLFATLQVVSTDTVALIHKGGPSDCAAQLFTQSEIEPSDKSLLEKLDQNSESVHISLC